MPHLKGKNSHSKEQVIGEFFDEWALYQKILKNNYLFHNETHQLLHNLLEHAGNSEFNLLDFGCGDAASMVDALRKTNIKGYYAVDLSQTAIQAAKNNMQSIDCKKYFKTGTLKKKSKSLLKKWIYFW